MKDLAVENSARIGLAPFRAEQELRNAIVAKVSTFLRFLAFFKFLVAFSDAMVSNFVR
jgi:hypothetical protein